jgi:hypothetical protein
MFIAVQLAEDLKVLLARTTPSKRLISNALMVTWAKDYGKFEFVKMFLDFDHSAVIPPDCANALIVRKGLDGLRCVWNQDPKFCISEKGILPLISSDWNQTSKDAYHADVVDLLRKHRGQWRFTREFREAVDDKFPLHNDLDVRKLYYSLWEDEEADDLSKDNAGSGSLEDLP